MCAPDIPKPLPPRQAAQAPDAGSIARRTSDSLRKRMGYAGAGVSTGTAAPAVTTGKSLLGQ
jgi:hypothetical protein